MPWQLAAMSDDRRTLTLAVVEGDGDCVLHAGYTVSMREDVVRISEVSRQSGGPACADAAKLGVWSIRMPKPLLKDVRLEHASTSPDFPPTILG